MTRIFFELQRPIKSMLPRLLLLLCGGLLVLPGTVCGDDVKPQNDVQVSVRIQAQTQVAFDRVYLIDIAAIQAPLTLKQKLAQIELGPAARPGKVRNLPGSWIVSRIKAVLGTVDGAELTVPEQVAVARAWQPLPTDLLRAELTRYLKDQLPGTRFQVNRFKVRGPKALPTGKLTVSIVDRKRKRLAGNISLPAIIYVDNTVCGSVTLSAWIDCYKSIVCAKTDLFGKTVLTARDLEYREVNIAKAPARLLTRLEAAVGKATRRTIKAGTCLRPNLLQSVPVIRKGDRVQMVARNGALRLVTFGVAKSNGDRGAQIRVENLTSRKIVVGRVKDARTVEVLF